MRLTAILAVLLVLPGVQPQSSDAGGSLHIVELLPAPDGAVGQREFIELYNPGSTTVALQGWRIEDSPTASGAVNGYTFSSGFLAAGSRVVVWSNGSADARGPSWSTSASKTVWNDAGDAATLLNPTGVVAHWFAYGNNVASAPAGFDNSTRPAAPARSASLAFANGLWGEGVPTPGLAPGQEGGSAGASVENVAPTASLTSPANAKPSELVTFTVRVADANGDDDVAGWTLRSGATVHASDNTSGSRAVALRAPATTGAWSLHLEVTDRAGAVATANTTVQIRSARLAVQVPDSGGIRFPALTPGQRNVTSLESFLVRNEGADAAPVLLDVSPFSGPGIIPVDGNLWVGVAVGEAAPTWSRYERPLQPLPSLPAGGTWSIWLRIDTVPTPLAAGSYGTSFTVVPG